MSDAPKPRIDLQSYITLGYLCIVIVGMMFDFNYYNKFSINIFEYSDILDFLLAPVKNSLLIIFAAATVVVVLIFFKLDKIWMEKRPKSYKRFNFGMSTNWNQRYRPFMVGFSLLAYMWLASSYYGDMTYDRFSESPKRIELTFDSGGKTISGNLIGKNSDYVFLMAADSTVKAIPVSSDVQEIVIGKLEPEEE